MRANREDILRYTYAKLRNAPRLSQDHIKRNGRPLKKRTGYLRLKKYIDDFLKGMNENRFIVMPGLRGVGKTTILLQLYDYLTNVKGIEQDRILYLSVDELKVYLDARIIDVIDVFISDIHETSPVHTDKELFIFIDESHYDPKWSQAGKILYDQSKKIFMIFTGSSALSLEINVDAARRTKKETIFPMNFSEYLLLRYNIYPPSGTSTSLRNLIFSGDSIFIKETQHEETTIKNNSLKLRNSLEKEWEDYLCCRGFPFGLFLNSSDVYEKTYNITERVIEKDVFALQSFNTETFTTISRILMFLAMQKPGGTSDANLADNLKTSPHMVRKILNVLEKTQLIFNVKPYGAAGKTIRKPWKYYFLSPSVNAAINFKLGRYDERDRQFLGILTENLVASHFFKMKEIMNIPIGIFYDADKKGVDFLLFNGESNIVPVEVGIGKNKETKQLTRAIDKYDSGYGVLVSNTVNKIQKRGDIIFIPPVIFSFL